MILAYLAIAFLALTTVYSAIASFRREDTKPSWIFPAGSRRSVRRVLGALSVLLLIALGLWLGLSGRHANRGPTQFLIPEGYTGWIRIEFGVQGATPLPLEGGGYVVRIPDDGVLQTSSAEQFGWAQDHYYYYSTQGKRALADSGEAGLIWGRINGEASGTAGQRKYEEFFVGTAQQFKNQASR